MNKLKITMVSLITAISLTVFASPDHDHGAPTFQPPKGGVLKSTHTIHFELVKGAKGVTIYAYGKDGKVLATKGLVLTAELEIPRKKATSLKLDTKEASWEATVDAGGAHRYTLKLNIDDGKEKDHVKFTVENK